MQEIQIFPLGLSYSRPPIIAVNDNPRLTTKRASVINVTILGLALIVTNEPWTKKWSHLFNSVLVAVTPGQAYPHIDCGIDESVIRKMYPLILAITSSKFKPVFLHV